MKPIKLALAVTIALVGIGTPGIKKANASSYTITHTEYYQTHPIYHAANKSQSAYVWNKAHTKKIHNLKNYPNTNWDATAAITLKHNGKSALYYAVIASTPNNKANVEGYVWHGYLTKGYNKNYAVWNNLALQGFTSTSDYQSYINQSSSQQLTRDVLKLFPNSSLSLSLSNYVENRDMLADDSATFNKSYSNAVIPSKANNYFYHSYKDTRSTTTRLQEIETALNAEGYNATKRASLKGYQIGIYYVDKYYGDTDDTGLGIILAKPTN